MRIKQPEIPQSIRVGGVFQLPKFNSKYAFMSNRKASKNNESSQNTSHQKKMRESSNLSLRFNRHRYSEISNIFQTPDQIRKLRSSENLSNKNVKNKSTKSRLSQKQSQKLTPRLNQRILSVSTKSVKRKSELNVLIQFTEQRDISQDKQAHHSLQKALKFTIQNSRATTQKSVKKLRDSRIRRERKSEILSVKQSISRLSNQRPITPQQQTKQQQEKIDHIEQQIVDPSYLILIQKILANICQSIKSGSSDLYELCLCYITMDKYEQQKLIYNLLTDPVQITMIKQLLTLQRLSIYVIVYVQKVKMSRKITITGLWQLIVNTFKSHSVMSDLLLQMLHESNRINKKQYKIKEIGIDIIIQVNKKKQNKFQSLQPVLRKDFLKHNRSDKMFELIYSLFVNAMKIESLEYINVIDKTLKWEVLKLPTFPYLPPAVKQYSLVLDLDETLIHFSPKTMKLQVRPYAEEFILRMSKLFQITIFTAGTKQYADELIDQIDPTHCISFRLYRNHINIHEGIPVKDLSQIGRNLKNTIMVDNMADNFRLQPNNGILISSWYGDLEDTALHKLENVLKNIMKLYSQNISEGIKRWGSYIKQHISFSTLIYQLKQDI